jgi:hypothetical protein
MTGVINQEIIALSINIGEQHVAFAYGFETKGKKSSLGNRIQIRSSRAERPETGQAIENR